MLIKNRIKFCYNNFRKWNIFREKSTSYRICYVNRFWCFTFNLEIITKEYVGPYIGQKALEVSAWVAIISIIVIAIIMIVAYRLPGALSVLALISYVGIIINIMSQLGISLTLPGIAGLILSLGMAVDANVIIFERLKEELKAKVAPKKHLKEVSKMQWQQ